MNTFKIFVLRHLNLDDLVLVLYVIQGNKLKIENFRKGMCIAEKTMKQEGITGW